jgi:NlpC/P60 family putative phage cell wall peptidase
MIGESETLRSQVVAEARSWVGTPYHHQGHVKGQGVDCGWLPIMCFRLIGAVPMDFDPGNYSSDWYMHKSEERYLAFVERFARQVDAAAARPADIALFKIGKCLSHTSILIGGRLMVHANRKASQVEIARVDQCEITRHLHSYWSVFS